MRRRKKKKENKEEEKGKYKKKLIKIAIGILHVPHILRTGIWNSLFFFKKKDCFIFLIFLFSTEDFDSRRIA